MTEHYNIQISIQRVTKDSAQQVMRGIAPASTERTVTPILEVKVTAETEILAYAKAHKLLFANGPEEVLAMHKRAFGESQA